MNILMKALAKFLFADSDTLPSLLFNVFKKSHQNYGIHI